MNSVSCTGHSRTDEQKHDYPGDDIRDDVFLPANWPLKQNSEDVSSVDVTESRVVYKRS